LSFSENEFPEKNKIRKANLTSDLFVIDGKTAATLHLPANFASSPSQVISHAFIPVSADFGPVALFLGDFLLLGAFERVGFDLAGFFLVDFFIGFFFFDFIPN
jgi:hypothetical protein